MKSNTATPHQNLNTQQEERESLFNLHNCFFAFFAALTFAVIMAYPFLWKKETAEAEAILANATPLELGAALPAGTESMCVDGKLVLVTKDQAFFMPYIGASKRTPIMCKTTSSEWLNLRRSR